MVETSTKTIPPRVPGFGLYYSEHVTGSENPAAPSVPGNNNSGVSFEDAKRTRQFNVIVLGSAGTGKTALIERFMHDAYLEKWDPTIEEEYHRQILVDGEVALLEIINTAGLEQFSSLNDVYMKSADGFILAFSLTQENSLKEAVTLRNQIHRIKGPGSVPIVAVGLNSDLFHEWEVDAATIQSLSTQWNIPFYEASVKRKWHVDDVFEDLVRQLRHRYPPDPVRKRGKWQQGSCIIM
ncbi:P-loop containing nucleoside triphosphate hydrolase protein [Mycena rebaudengoi]|nr:P-loop containing nucleoside triphosphate hydrolase protein [Mycena rebaudengoi]